MKTADMPAMPISPDLIRPECGETLPHAFPYGLAKREYFAGLAMQALVSDIVNAEVNGYEVTSDQTAKEAVAQADALLAELDKENQ